MPRLSPSIFKQAYSKSELLPLILRGARTLDSSINELRWLKEHVQTLKPSSPGKARLNLLKLCQRRSKGEPLQYILGSQPFGELDIKCRPGVLIPRPETELYTTYLASLINAPPTSNEIPNLYSKRANPKTSPPSLRILDLCSGSGCISLLLHSLLSPRFPQLQIFGLDISSKAVALSKKNLSHNVLSGYLSSSASKDTPNRPPQVQFGIADILADLAENLGQFDVIISNPPYISRSHFSTQTTRSVRKYEPLLALVPRDENPDIFYERLIRLHQIHLSNVTVMEVGDAAQAVRVVELAGEMDYQGFRKAPRVRNRLEIWRDDPGLQDPDRDQEIRNIAGREVRFRGCGKIRAVVLYREKTDRHSVHKTLLNSNVVERLGVPPGEMPLTKQKLRRQLNKERQKRKTLRRNQARKTEEMKEERARASQIWKRDAEVLRMKIREILMKRKSGAFEERS
ncbi:uncharacterized protein RSE6_13665 [Rhynchosporium secalis]|uniref:peptide chain release factor N(5)-glutamine methyltransferase n=1 Tax=Rhynchosporium secalis TaxID=38038 RepID=A0A1E1MTD0_RHYSE|nr:uncharacterized protein RSE6_13665 [Rhynchosporium secalis]